MVSKFVWSARKVNFIYQQLPEDVGYHRAKLRERGRVFSRLDQNKKPPES